MREHFSFPLRERGRVYAKVHMQSTFKEGSPAEPSTPSCFPLRNLTPCLLTLVIFLLGAFDFLTFFSCGEPLLEEFLRLVTTIVTNKMRGESTEENIEEGKMDSKSNYKKNRVQKNVMMEVEKIATLLWK